jgi:4-amino-4-deoxy-L-arabinose transferase-like glycosyltransferase
MDRWARLEIGRGTGWAAVAVAGAALVFQGIGGSPLLDPNEAKHALIAKHTLEAGRWLEPVLNGRAYHDKPSLFYILVGACYRMFGVSEFSARLVPGLSIWATLLATYGLASVRSTQAGLLAAYLLASSLFFVHLGRFTNLDGVFTLALTAALFSALMRFPSAGPWRIPYLSFLFAGIATLIKGPVALVMLSVPAGFAAFRPGLDWRRVVAGAAVIIAIVAGWVIPVALWHRDYLVDFIWLHNLQRYFGEVQIFHQQPLLFFLPIVFGALLPWSTLLPLALARALRRVDREFFLAVYALTVVAFFSLSSGKLATYVVPAFPPLAVVLAWWSWDRLSEPGSKGRRAALAGVVLVALLAPIGMGAAMLAAPELLGAAACLIPASVLALGIWARRGRFDNGTDIVVLCSAGCLAASVLLGALGGSSAGRFTSDRDLATVALRNGRPDRMIVYRVRPFSFLFYTGWEGIYKVSDEQYREAITAPGRALILTKEGRLPPLAEIVPGVEFTTVARNARHLLLRPVPAQSR